MVEEDDTPSANAKDSVHDEQSVQVSLEEKSLPSLMTSTVDSVYSFLGVD